MALLGRRLRTPAGLRALFDEHERLLAMAEDGAAAVAATQFGLWVPASVQDGGPAVGPAEGIGSAAEPTGSAAAPGSVAALTSSAAALTSSAAALTSSAAAPGWRRIGWDQVVLATWTETGLQVIEGVRDDTGVVTDLPTVRLPLAEPRNLPAVVKTRVEASIARWEQVRVPGGTGRIVARRRPGTDGLIWTARLDTGTPDSAAARAALAGYLERAAKLTPEQLFPA